LLFCRRRDQLKSYQRKKIVFFEIIDSIAAVGMVQSTENNQHLEKNLAVTTTVGD
jgi:hypothetical protein